MNGRWKLGVALLIGVAIAVPATVVARGSTNASGDAERFSTASTQDVSTSSKHFVPIGLVMPVTNAQMAVTVSAQMTQGKAKFRVVGGNDEALPASVQFGSKAANSFTFGAVDACPGLHVEWKKVGKTEARAAQVSYQATFESNACL